VGLVGVQHRVQPGRLGLAGAGSGRLPHPGQHERPQQPAGLIPELAFGDADQADPAVQDVGHVEAGLGRADHRAHERAQQEGTQPSHDRADDLRLRGRGLRLIPGPEPAQPDRIVQPLQVGTAEGRLGQQPGDLGQGRARAAQQRQTARPEHVVDPWAPVGVPDAVQDPDQVVHDQVGVAALQHVEGWGCVGLVRVQQHQPLQRPLRQALQQVADQVALGVDDHHPTAGLDVLQGEVADQGRLARPGRADQV
jgi:hypothetical protein